jgi:hypothetical protein
MSLLSTSVLLALSLGTSALRLGKSEEPTQCNKEPNWGVIIDGKDAAQGAGAYGKSFLKPALATLSKVYEWSDAPDAKAPDRELFERIANLHGEPFNASKGTHTTKQVRQCLGKLPEDKQSKILENVIAWKGLRANHERWSNKGDQMIDVLKEYNSRQKAAITYEDKVKAIAFLAQNVCFGHFLENHNGRTRTALIQYELRRLHIACGTFLYNNNRDMFFNSKDYAERKIQEGIEAHQHWEKTGQNPWADKAKVKQHLHDFPQPKSMVNCWSTFALRPGDKTPTSIE